MSTMNENDSTQYVQVCKPTGPAFVHPVLEGEEARAAMHDLLDSFLDHGCAMLMMTSGCEGGYVAVGIVPLSPDEPEHRRRAEAMAKGIGEGAPGES